MELKDFIVSAITDIANGVKEADSEIYKLGGMVNPGTHIWGDGGGTEFVHHRTKLNFDIAVSATKSGTAEAGAKARIWVVEASIGGGESSTNESVSRLTFSLDVVLPSDAAQEFRIGKVKKPVEG
ncbi:MAG: trypco2 family protein [Roseovarius sp.]|uniref:trypco2 family protein n=1 Tax=Roseovarius sp. TaxID=1486281 RepID=UPI0032EF8ACA